MAWNIALPWIAKTLAGPLAGLAVNWVKEKVPSLGSTAEEIKQSLAGMKPEEIVEIKKLEADLQYKLAALGYENLEKLEQFNADAYKAALAAVNATMQAEAKAEHWPTYSWRPFIGFVFGLYIASMFLLPLFGKQPVPLSPDLTLAVGAILGVASWFRGKMQADPNIPTVNRG